MYTGDYKAIVSVNAIHNHGGFLVVWKAGENQRQGSPSWNAVMDNSGHSGISSLIISPKKMYHRILHWCAPAKVLAQEDILKEGKISEYKCKME